MCGFCRHESTLGGGGIGTHVGAEMQEDLWLTDKQRGDVTKWSSSKNGVIRFQCFLSVVKVTVGRLEKCSSNSQRTEWDV